MFVHLINLHDLGQHMPTGLKQTSSTIAIGFGVTETAPNTFTQDQVDLNLSPLDREVFVVLAVNLDPATPEYIDSVSTSVGMSLTTTSQTAVAQLDNSNCLASSANSIRQDAAAPGAGGVAFQSLGMETPPATLEYVGIIATNDFFVQVQGGNNANPRRGTGKLYGYRARASADIYAALVQSEVLSA